MENSNGQRTFSIKEHEDAITEATKYVKAITAACEADLALTIPASKLREFRAMLCTLIGSAARDVHRITKALAEGP